MNHRQHKSELVDTQETLRAILLKCFYKFDISEVDSVLAKQEDAKLCLNKLIEATKGTLEGNFFKYYNYLITSLFHLLRWGRKELNAEDGTLHLRACAVNIQQIDFEYFNYIPGFRVNLEELCETVR